ncbi:MAG: hypothetical protein HY879_26265 [Deltaproteobacteria bacterium]|nr:hypothetical protein [Deltaproteobacteria bacterium]
MSSPKTKIKSSETRSKILQQILPTIRKNCTLADAHHSGLFSLCGLFLRMKDQYNWEKQNPPWSPTDKDRLLKWIDQKEALWLECLDSPFEPIRINGHTFDYLDNRQINQFLIPAGLYYGAGYGRGLKPTFFLGRVKEKRLSFGFTVIVLERNLACDLSLTLAQRQGRTIVLHLDPLRFFLWSKIQETEQWEREATALALSFYGWNPSAPPDGQMEPIIQSELETVLFHELGEARDRTIPQGLWRSLLSLFPFSRVELYLRTLKDLLADTHPGGTLTHIIESGKAGSLAFYLSNLKGLRRTLFPEIIPAIRKFKKEMDWSGVIRAKKEGRHRLVNQAGRIRELAGKWIPARPEEFSARFEQEFFNPLGL